MLGLGKDLRVCRHAERWEHSEPLPFDPGLSPAYQAVVVYLGPKGPKPIVVEKSFEFETPGGKFIKRKRPYVWDDEEALEFIRPRLHLMEEALRIYPEWPEGAEEVWGGNPGWACPGPPLCALPNCLAKRDPSLLTWDPDGVG